MFPMVSSLEEAVLVKKICNEVMAELNAKGIEFDKKVSLGIMIETLEAVFNSKELTENVSFFR